MPTRTTITSRSHHQCHTPGCTRPARSTIAHLCGTCRQRMRRNGDARQANIKRTELRPMEDRVREIIRRGHLPMIRKGLQTINDALVRNSEGAIAMRDRGQAMNRHTVIAADEILKVAKNVDPLESGITIAALYLLAARAPRCIVSDEGMAGQLTRVYRAQWGIAMGSTWDDKRQRTALWYRPLPKDTTALIALTLREAYIGWLSHVTMADQKDMDARQQAARELAAGFAGI